MIIQTEDKSLYRDTKSMTLLSKDVHAKHKYKEEKARQARMNRVIDDVENLKNDITDIKQLLQRLVEKDG